MSEQELRELAALAPTRQRVYVFLSAAFAQPPSLEMIRALCDEDVRQSVRETFYEPAPDGGPTSSEAEGGESIGCGAFGLGDLVPPCLVHGPNARLKTLEAFPEQALDSLRELVETAESSANLERQARSEFMNLFKVPGNQYVAPYESVFRDSREIDGQTVRGLLMGQSAVDAQKWYRLAALDISSEYKDLPDHIALELNYLAHLCALEHDFAVADDNAKLTRAWEMERDFLAAHVVSWVEAFSAKIRDQFYVQTA